MSKFVLPAIFTFAVGILIFSEIPISVTRAEVSKAIETTIASEKTGNIEQSKIESLVMRSVKILEARQAKRLKYLVAAYLAIWFLLALYALRLMETQNELQKRIDILEKRGQEEVNS